MTDSRFSLIIRTGFAVCVTAFSLGVVLSSPSSTRAADPKPLSSEQLEFFEKKVRPVLVERCYACHSQKKARSGLKLDTRDGVLKGGDSGRVVVPGKPEASRLIMAVEYTDAELRMPPKAKLPPEQIAALTEWVKRGAPDPRTAADAKAALAGIEKLMQDAQRHWAFQPVKERAVPKTADPSRVRTPVDAFLLAKLQTVGLTFARPADKRTLIRRATLDLHGIPPTPEEVDAFEKDPSPKAYEKLLDKLLASPRYGERWARHWLDVARYADNMGGIFNVNAKYVHAWTYRDYVIKAFNDDKPFDKFVVEQLAADLLPPTPGNNWALAAMGFVTVGRRSDGRVDDDAIDDRIDVVSRGLLGLTAGCARCHDHKLEPIPTKDYYALYGIFRSCTEPRVYPELVPQPDTAERRAYLAENEKAHKALIEAHVRLAAVTLVEIRGQVGDYLLSVHQAGGKSTSQNPKAKNDINKKKLHEFLHNDLAAKWAEWVVKNPAVFGPWVEFAKLPAADFASKAGSLAKALASNADKKLNPLAAKAFAGKPPSSLEDVAKRYNDMFAGIAKAWQQKAASALAKAGRPEPADATAAPQQLGLDAIGRVYKAEQGVALENDDAEKLRKVLIGPSSPFAPVPKQFAGSRLFLPRALEEVNKVTKAVAALKTHPGAEPARAMALKEAKPYNAKVFVRGNPQTRGPDAPRAFFTVLAGPERPRFPKDKSGRLELAKAISSPQNPLTARVFVNRLWLWHFGKGLVGTPSDFGFRGDKPTHPELLDYLAARFIAGGWSVKNLHKLVMLSAAYQQSSRQAEAVIDGADPRIADPENKLYWRANPRQLEFEAYRDSILAVAGRLDTTQGGPAVDVTQATTCRRTVYAHVDRRTMPGLFRSFDFPDPNFSAASRAHTASPPQALFLLNSPFVLDNAKALAATVKPASAAARPAAVRKLYGAAFQRGPSRAELKRALKFLEAYPANDVVVPEATAWSYGFADYDEKTKKVLGFTPLRFAGDIVKGEKVGAIDVTGLEITPEGGKARVKAAVRRWTAPYDGKVDVAAELSHTAPTGGGVVSRVVSSRHGLLGEWSAANKSVPTPLKQVEVKKGDTLDFLTFAKSNSAGEKYRWAPTISMPDREMLAVPGMMMKWDAKTHFLDTAKMPAPLGPWEELAQVLLMSNEFAVVE